MSRLEQNPRNRPLGPGRHAGPNAVAGSRTSLGSMAPGLRLSVLLGLALVGGTPAAAQEVEQPGGFPDGNTFNAHNLHVAAFDGDLRDPLLLVRPGRFRQWDWFAGGVLEYANAPLVRYEREADDPDGEIFRNEILDHVVALNLSAGVAFHERIRLDLAAPLFFASWDGNQQYQGVDFGDIRATATVPILLPDENDEGAGLAVAGKLDIPSGATRDFLGNRTVGGGADLAFSYAVSNFTATATAGAMFVPRIDRDNLNGPDAFLGGLAVGYRVHETTSLNLEGLFEVPFRQNEVGLTESPGELTFTARHRRPSGAHLLAGAAAGVTRGAGAARFRVFLGGGFGKIIEPAPKDFDGDGYIDSEDACPEDPENFNQYRDEDGCPDGLANLTVRVMYDGQPIEGADVAYGEPESEERETFLSTTEGRVRDDLMPGLVFEGTATKGRCLAGDGAVTLAEGANRLDIVLNPMRGGKVIYELVDPDGNPVRDAVSTWRTDAEGCADPAGYALGSDGRYEHPIGAGTHTVFIDAPGYRIYREDVTVEPGDEILIRTVMKPTKVRVEAEQIAILEKVYFDTASARIKEQSFDLLDEVADTIIANDVGRVEVQGHTDSRGSDAYNLDLSQRRSESVRDYLIRRGVPASQLVARGYGENQPVAPNDTPENLAKNRRVVFYLLDQADQTIKVQEP